ncbi:MAG: DUF1211 domain-containing protein [Candidatus Eremiobacteraeota bacterium]|nr:DUF1211 domain-containing protein [Candidatus Eremiobacteraeota bacterium]
MTAFRERLAPDERHFVGRLEAFGDIVVGFSMSQLAVQFTVPSHGADLFAHPLTYTFFFGTFAIVSVYWMRYHRIMSTGFVPSRPDLFLAFAYLALVALVPYAMIVNLRFATNETDAAYSLAFYVGVFLALNTVNAALDLRGLRRGWDLLDEPARHRLWRQIVGSAVLIVFLGGALVADAFGGATAASSVIAVLAVALVVARRITPLPSPGLLRIASGTFEPDAVS